MTTKKLLAEKCIYKRIGMALASGIRLTPDDAKAYPFCTSRLGGAIFHLRRGGMSIETDIITVKCADGHIAHPARYRATDAKKVTYLKN